MSNIKLTTDEAIEKSVVLSIGKEIKAIFGSDVFDGQIATHKTIKTVFHQIKHIYTFEPDIELDEDAIEDIASIISSMVDVDFDIEFDYDEDEGEFDPEEIELEDNEDLDPETSAAIDHDLWVKGKLKDGWRYGLEYSEDEMTDPRIRPYYQLTPKQKGKE